MTGSRTVRGFPLGSIFSVGLALVSGALVSGFDAGSAAARGLTPPEPQPAGDRVQAGLSVTYYYSLFRHIDELIEWAEYKDGSAGEPILEVNSRAGKGTVLTSDASDAVGARMEGYIHLDRAGFYTFAFESNDGVRLEIAGQKVVEDPDVHKDRFSELGAVEVAEPGWYPIVIHYFERKNTSTIKFHWQLPGGEGTMPVVPGSALVHVSE